MNRFTNPLLLIAVIAVIAVSACSPQQANKTMSCEEMTKRVAAGEVFSENARCSVEVEFTEEEHKEMGYPTTEEISRRVIESLPKEK